MNSWLTTHYPHASDSHPWFIYLKHNFRHLAAFVQLGDEIFFYELAGSTKKGARAIVGRGTVIGPIKQNQSHREFTKDEGSEVWPWEIPCTNFNRGIVSQIQLYELLHWPISRRPRIRGGIMELNEKIAASIRNHF